MIALRASGLNSLTPEQEFNGRVLVSLLPVMFL
jgi:hypothetical protein